MRPPRLFAPRLVLVAALVCAVVPVAPSASGAQCATDLEQRNSWSQVPGGPGAVAMEDDDPCRLIAVRPNRTVQASNDGGTTWQDMGTSPMPVRRLVSDGLGTDALLIPEGDGLFVTTDRGRSWQAAAGLPGVVLDVTADERDASTLFAVVRPTSAVPAAAPAPVLPVAQGSSIYRSQDRGRSFTPLAGASGLQASAVAPDPGAPGRLWMGVDGVAGGLFVSTDAGSTFVRVAGGAVRGLGTSRLAGGGSEVIAATSTGFLVSRDGGNTVSSRATSVDSTGIALEWNHPSAFMALSKGRAVRSADTGNTADPQSAGLPGECGATDLVRDRSIPSVFSVRCADGSSWRYRSDGTDLSATDRPDGTASVVPTSNLGPSTPMKLLKRLATAHRDSTEDGSVAFDGTLLYYAASRDAGIVHRQNAKTGKDAGDLVTQVPYGILQLTYDANRHHLFVVDVRFRLWDVDLRNGRAVRMFRSPISGSTSSEGEDREGGGFPGAFTYDPATDRFLFANDGGSGWEEYDRDGRRRRSCTATDLPVVITISGGPMEASIGGIVATGDGQVYIEAEDDATVLRMDRSCHVLASFNHEYFSEAGAENDALACDTTTFETPAVWLRDATAGFMAAYEVPGGYCALPSHVTVTSPEGVAAGERGPVCATLRLTSTGRPLAGLPIDLLVAGRGIASPVTDARGRACADYVPLPREAGASKGPGKHSARQPVLAAFLGTPAYRPSSARRSVLVSSEVPAAPAVRPAPPPPVVHAAAPIVAVPVVPPAQPPPPPPNVPQSQPIAQGHPGAQPGAQGAPGGAMAPEEEEGVATQAADVAEFRAREDPALVWPAAAIPLAAGVLMAGIVARRRRASRVIGQWA
ncbi:MAG: hypothetical protein JJD92_05335 [Frankiaceae bacterium]|nr:hypothetical protein [Frankiaceae bacterium]